MLMTHAVTPSVGEHTQSVSWLANAVLKFDWVVLRVHTLIKLHHSDARLQSNFLQFCSESITSFNDLDFGFIFFREGRGISLQRNPIIFP